MAERIYIRSDGGGLSPLEEEPFSTEDELQALIAEHPELLDGQQIRPGDPRRWILVSREKGIAESSDTGARWSVDHLIIDQDAVPTLAEVKRGSNPEIRRAIVGQLLEYAAHASKTWSAVELRRTFEDSANTKGDDPNEVLGRLLQTDGDLDADLFWEKVATNLSARRMRLLFVADEIPDPLEHVVEFLNEQMPNIEVLAVEIKQFRGGQAQTLVPRVLGRTAKASTQGPAKRGRNLTRETFLAEFTVDQMRNAATRLLDTAREAGATLEWGPSSVSIRGRCPLWQQPVTVAWLNTPSNSGGGWMRTRYFTFGAAILEYDPGPEMGLRTLLLGWVNSFRDYEFTTDASSKGVTAWSVDYDTAAQNIDLLTDRLSSILEELKEL